MKGGIDMVVQSDDQLGRLLKLQHSVTDLVLHERRSPVEIAEVLQAVVDYPEFYERLGLAPIPIAFEDWERFDREVFGKKADYAGLVVPSRDDLGRLWPIVVPEWTAMNKLVRKWRERDVNVWTHVKNLDKDVPIHDRDPKNGTYVISCRARIEVDEELKDLSANDLKTQGIQTLTLPERLRLDFLYWWKTRRHLDQKSWTLCAGSRGRDGGVPYVYWHPMRRGVRVRWTDTLYRDEGIRARLAVS